MGAATRPTRKTSSRKMEVVEELGDGNRPITETATEEEFDIANALLQLTPGGPSRSLRSANVQKEKETKGSTRRASTPKFDEKPLEEKSITGSVGTPSAVGERRGSLRMTTFKLMKPIKAPAGFFDAFMDDCEELLRFVEEIRGLLMMIMGGVPEQLELEGDL
ncbi:hypothetical protein BC829DRAFT_382233 [Chytridium lagenaria]|nr:hypothetical protein BC829DRAFT_398617 [Chytridium lagenaria]KAI8853508.1 hypothetical protein BC829DRAFT_382233 [Chytridium lagenaria]